MKKNVFWSVLPTILGIVCFPANPLVLSGLLVTDHHQVTYITGWVVWGIGMVLVMAPIIMFPRHGGRPASSSAVWKRLQKLYAKSAGNEFFDWYHTSRKTWKKIMANTFCKYNVKPA